MMKYLISPVQFANSKSRIVYIKVEDLETNEALLLYGVYFSKDDDTSEWVNKYLENVTRSLCTVPDKYMAWLHEEEQKYIVWSYRERRDYYHTFTAKREAPIGDHRNVVCISFKNHKSMVLNLPNPLKVEDVDLDLVLKKYGLTR